MCGDAAAAAQPCWAATGRPPCASKHSAHPHIQPCRRLALVLPPAPPLLLLLRTARVRKRRREFFGFLGAAPNIWGAWGCILKVWWVWRCAPSGGVGLRRLPRAGLQACRGGGGLFSVMLSAAMQSVWPLGAPLRRSQPRICRTRPRLPGPELASCQPPCSAACQLRAHARQHCLKGGMSGMSLCRPGAAVRPPL